MPWEYFFSRLYRIDFSIIGLISVSIINSWSVRNLPAMKSAASTFSVASASFISNTLSSSVAVVFVTIGWGLGIDASFMRFYRR